MAKLNRMSQLEAALNYAEEELIRADFNYSSGDITFRMYLMHRKRVEDIEEEISKMNKQ